MSALTKTLGPTLTSATGLIGGYSVARATGNRPLGGAVLAVAGAAAFRGWKRNAGAGRAALLTGAYTAAFGLSHPLAKKIGAWPSVYAVTGAVALASLTLGKARKKSSFELVTENIKHAAKQAKKGK
ncbi:MULTISPECIES: hypothetical protein [Rothia]|nr:hypothetical protein [Rothia kristinae]TDP56231.1 hypothetical protein DEU33_1116 [Kocuria sp. AG109]SIM33875.1 Uncharacterised protein [Mycobacteroides abscessus subsp. abscessus]MCA1170156.1 hypothetical protein [Rothia kristinae]MCT1358280.1 hypothetical protein [Rothia kristinae]MCT1393715.1 hypothetical protein [Rothia kristinae]